MKVKSFAIAVALCIGFSMPLFAQKAAIEKIIEMGENDNQVMHQLDILTNRFGGRLVGSDAYENAAEWMLHEYAKWGIEAHLEEAGEVPVGFNRGHWSGKLLSEDGMVLHFATPSYTSGTHGKQRGVALLEPRSQAEFDGMKHALKGAWVLVTGSNTGWPIDTSEKGDSIRKVTIAKNAEIELQNREIHMSNRKNGEDKELIPTIDNVPCLFYREMIEAGVLGFIQKASTPIRALYDRPMLNNPETTFDNLPTVPDIKLDEHQYAKIEQMVKERREPILEFDIRNHFKLGPIKYHNVVATIKGEKYPDEYVIVSGHLDAFDVATGGIDCGTGIGPMMEVARMIAMSGAKPKRSIVFVAFAAEEFGLLGAKAYCETHKDELDKISYLFNRDGGPLPPTGIDVPEAMYDDFVKVCEPLKKINSDIPFEITIAKPGKKPMSMGGTDATVFGVAGVPYITFKNKDVKGYNFTYGEIWHTENDLYNKNIPEYQEHTATVTAIVTLGIANLDHQLSREGMYID
ncbi:MAG: M20/M25/M40 family metallo-hydrolase [Rikenellaceae bacterium]